MQMKEERKTMAKGNIFLRFPGGKYKALTLSYDDGAPADERLLDIFNAHHMKATFNLNAKMLGEGLKEAALVNKRYEGHEIALHGLNHLLYDSIPHATIAYETMHDRELFEKATGRIITGMAYPFGLYNEEVFAAMKAAGVDYSRTCAATHAFRIPDNFYLWHPTCHHNDERLSELADTFLEKKFTDDLYDKRPMLFYVWGHSFEFENNNNWELMENFCDKVSGKDNVWYATNIEIFHYVESFRRLRWNLEATRVQNPNAEPIWFTCCGKDYCVKPGETLKVDNEGI